MSVGVALWGLRHARQKTHERVEWAGLGMLSAALGLLPCAVSQSQRPGWDRQGLLLLFAVGLIGMLVFVLIERWHPTPLIAFGLFRQRAFSATSTVYFLNTFTGMGVSFAVIVFLQE